MTDAAIDEYGRPDPPLEGDEIGRSLGFSTITAAHWTRENSATDTSEDLRRLWMERVTRHDASSRIASTPVIRNAARSPLSRLFSERSWTFPNPSRRVAAENSKITAMWRQG
jgi:hypothetical protein